MKKGFSLIEIILVIGILCILLSAAVVKISGVRSVENKVDAEMFGNSLIDFVNNSKEYCRYKDSKCCIYIDTYSGEINLSYNSKAVKSMKIPKGFSINNVGGFSQIYINRNGFIENNCSINFKDREGNKYCVSICVGTGHVDFHPQ